MKYHVDLHFTPLPTNYWVFYDRQRQSVVLDIYSTTVTMKEDLMPKNIVFDGMILQKMPSNMTLTGDWYRIVMDADSGWHASDPLVIGGNILRIPVWRNLRRVLPERQINWLMVASALTSVAIGVAAFFAVSFVLAEE